MFVRAGLEGDRMNALRRCVSAGEPLNPEVIDLWQAATGLDIYDGYGQTETVLLCANRPGMARRGSMGRPDRKSTRLNSRHQCAPRLPSSACKTHKTTYQNPIE